MYDEGYFCLLLVNSTKFHYVAKQKCKIVSVSYTSFIHVYIFVCLKNHETGLCLFSRRKKEERKTTMLWVAATMFGLLVVRLYKRAIRNRRCKFVMKKTLCVRRFHSSCCCCCCARTSTMFCNFINWISFTTWDFAKWHNTFTRNHDRSKKRTETEEERR